MAVDVPRDGKKEYSDYDDMFPHVNPTKVQSNCLYFRSYQHDVQRLHDLARRVG
jgi:hypothetical protein